MESSNHLPLQAHQSIDFGELANNRLVVKRDGNKEYYDPAILLKYLTGCLTGLN